MTKQFDVDVDESGRPVLPADFMTKYGLKPGTRIRREDNANGMLLRRIFVGAGHCPMPVTKGVDMKKRLFSSLFRCLSAALFLIQVCSMPSQSQEVAGSAAPAKIIHPEVPRMPAKELVRLLKKKAEIVIVDTQSADAFEMWHIPSAINITYDSTADPTNRQLMLMALPMDKQIVIYCLCEEGTDSAKMALELRQLGYSDNQVKVLEGGLVLWDGKGYPMVKQRIPE